jgi:hypothetical protein
MVIFYFLDFYDYSLFSIFRKNVVFEVNLSLLN